MVLANFDGARAAGREVECVRIEMSSDCAVPKFLVARGALPGVEKGKSGADGHAGWAVTLLNLDSAN